MAAIVELQSVPCIDLFRISSSQAQGSTTAPPTNMEVEKEVSAPEKAKLSSCVEKEVSGPQGQSALIFFAFRVYCGVMICYRCCGKCYTATYTWDAAGNVVGNAAGNVAGNAAGNVARTTATDMWDAAGETDSFTRRARSRMYRNEHQTSL